MNSVVIRNPELMSGEPTFRGKRVLVRTLFDYFEAGHTPVRYLEGFPTVDREMTILAIEEAKHRCSPAVNARGHDCQTCRLRV